MKKLAGIEFNEKEYEEIKNNYFNTNKKYIIKYNTIYEIKYGENVGLYTLEIYKKYPRKNEVPLMKKGRFIITSGDHVNSLLEREFIKI